MIYLFGDIHGDADELLYYLRQSSIKPGDTLVLLGDVGLNYRLHHHKDELSKAQLEKTGIHFLCIHGNHERRPATIPTYHLTEWRGGKAYIEDAYPHLYFAKDGEVFDLEGRKAIVLGGAYSIDKPYRLMRGWSWFEDEQPSVEIKADVKRRLDELDWKVDLVLSHTCPAKYIPREAMMSFVDQSTVDRSTEDWLDGIEDRLRYDAWYCGHWHINKRIDRMHFLFHELAWLPEKGEAE